MKLNQTELLAKLPRKNRNAGFTLVELLVVVAILAIIGGALIAAYDGLTTNAAHGTATNTISSLSQATRVFNSIEKKLPNNLETLFAADITGATFTAIPGDAIADTVATPTFAQFLPSALDTGGSAKLRVEQLTTAELTNLLAAGVTRVRYLDAAVETATSTTYPHTSDVPAADGGTAIISGPVATIDIPAQAFDAPRPGGAPTGRNRGRGFGFNLPVPATNNTTPSGVSLAVWSTTAISPALTGNPNVYDNVKVGANPTAKLVALGVGDYSTLVRGNAPDGISTVTKYLNSAPLYGNVNKEEYNHYILLIDVRQNPAKLVSVVDTKGDFVQEEFAETFDQKL